MCICICVYDPYMYIHTCICVYIYIQDTHIQVEAISRLRELRARHSRPVRVLVHGFRARSCTDSRRMRKALTLSSCKLAAV